MKNRVRFILFSTAVAVFTSSCTSSSSTSEEPVKKSRAKEIKRVPAAGVGALTPNTEKAFQDASYAAFVTRLGVPENEFTMKDKQTVLGMSPSPRSGSVHEAAIVVGILRDILTTPGGNNASFQTVDKVLPQAPHSDSNNVIQQEVHKTDTGRVLELRAREKGVDVINALAGNALLKTQPLFRMTWDAMKLDGNSDIFRQNLTTIIKSEALLWRDLAEKTGASEPMPVAALNCPPAQAPSTLPSADGSLPPAGLDTSVAAGAGAAGGTVAAAAPTGGVAPGLAMTAGAAALPGSAAATGASAPQPAEAVVPAETIKPISPEEASKLIASAQEAAAREDYSKAIADAKQIPTAGPNYDVAQESIKLWSNRAVQDLRKKAVREYRSASTINETSSKRSYLAKAKQYLEEALNNYPAASNLDVVKDNLDIITKETERLK